MRLTRQVSKKLVRGFGGSSNRPPAGGGGPPSVVEVLRGEILQLVAATQADDVAARAEVGGKLKAAKAALQHGEWLPWVAKNLPFSAASAKRSIQLFELRKGHPEVLGKLAPLGLTKVYVLLKLGPKERDDFVGKRHVVPSTGHEKAPLEMTVAEMMEVLHPPEPETPVRTRTRVLRGLRRQTQGLARLLSELWALVPKGVLRTPVRGALRALADELQVVAGALAAKSLIAGTVPRFR